MTEYELNQEILLIKQDKHKNNSRKNNMQFAWLMILLIPFLGMAVTLSADLLNVETYEIIDEGITFRCSKCGTKQWQSRKNRDWRGDYHCSACGEKVIYGL